MRLNLISAALMPSEPLTETAARGKAHQLLDNWLARWPKATINGYGAAAARLGFVDAVAPLLATSSLNLAVADIAEPLLVSPAALLGTGEADTAPAASSTLRKGTSMRMFCCG